jgi:hypothetical protein
MATETVIVFEDVFYLLDVSSNSGASEGAVPLVTLAQFK